MNLKDKPAFPRGAYSFNHFGEQLTVKPSEGMTLLQYYAGKSLSGLLSTSRYLLIKGCDDFQKTFEEEVELITDSTIFIAKRLIEKLEKLETNQTKENE